MEIKYLDLDTENLLYLISKVIIRRNYRVGIVCDRVEDFIKIIHKIYDLDILDTCSYTNCFINNLKTGSSIEYIHNGDDTARAYRYHEIFYYNCEIDERFKEYVLLPILRPIEEL